ncbi:MAG: glycoside hydrolase family 97 protein [Balneolaceae bacterium]
MWKFYSFIFFLITSLALSIQPSPLTIDSPGKVLKVSFVLEDGVPYYSIHRFGKEVIEPSRLGFEFKNMPALDRGFRIESTSENSVDETWTQVWGEKENIRDHHRELRVNLVEETGEERRMSVIFRVFDDGIGFRYEIPQNPGIDEILITNELTEFGLTGNHRSWYQKAYQWNRYEYLTLNTPLSEVDTVHTPMTMQSDDGLYLSIHQAALVDYSTMTLERTEGNRLKANLVPWGDNILVRTSSSLKTPWRTIQIADTPGGLITNYLILNLNEPNKIEDTSWIKPSKYVGIWWEMHLEKSTWGSGPLHGATTESAKNYIDFAAENGFDHVLVEGWNPGWDGSWYESGVVFDFTRAYEDFDLENVAGYAKEKEIRLMGHHETSASVEHYEGQMAEAFELYESLDIRAVKTGYVGHGQEIMRTDQDGGENLEWHHGQYMVNHHQRVVELAAKHEISLNVHEGIMDTGLRRTWPNLMSREVARGQEYNAWGEGDGIWNGMGNPPNHITTIPFTRMLAGPFDYTPGMMDMHYDEYRPENRVNHTLAKELAIYVVIYSPLQMAADLPENYNANSEPFQFIKDVPTDWQDTQVLNADIGHYITIVRKDRNSEEWYLGSVSDENGRNLEEPLHFLDSDRKYVAEIYRDGDDADWQNNPYEIVIEKKLVDSRTILPLRLAAGGGQAIRFRPAEEDDIERLVIE